METKQYTQEEKTTYALTMRGKGLSKYKPISLLSKVVGYSLIGYGLVGVDFGLSVWVGCLLLGIPLSLVYSKVKHYGKKCLFICGVMCNRKRLVYECRRVLCVRLYNRRLLRRMLL